MNSTSTTPTAAKMSKGAFSRLWSRAAGGMRACGLLLQMHFTPEECVSVVRGFREGIGSVISVGIVLTVLVSTDPRVKARVTDLIGDPVEGGRTIGARAGDLAQAVWLAARDQSLENAPLLLFVVVGAVLVLFMLRT